MMRVIIFANLALLLEIQAVVTMKSPIVTDNSNNMLQSAPISRVNTNPTMADVKNEKSHFDIKWSSSCNIDLKKVSKSKMFQEKFWRELGFNPDLFTKIKLEFSFTKSGTVTDGGVIQHAVICKFGTYIGEYSETLSLALLFLSERSDHGHFELELFSIAEVMWEKHFKIGLDLISELGLIESKINNYAWDQLNSWIQSATRLGYIPSIQKIVDQIQPTVSKTPLFLVSEFGLLKNAKLAVVRGTGTNGELFYFGVAYVCDLMKQMVEFPAIITKSYQEINIDEDSLMKSANTFHLPTIKWISKSSSVITEDKKKPYIHDSNQSEGTVYINARHESAMHFSIQRNQPADKQVGNVYSTYVKFRIFSNFEKSKEDTFEKIICSNDGIGKNVEVAMEYLTNFPIWMKTPIYYSQESEIRALLGAKYSDYLTLLNDRPTVGNLKCLKLVSSSLVNTSTKRSSGIEIYRFSESTSSKLHQYCTTQCVEDKRVVTGPFHTLSGVTAHSLSNFKLIGTLKLFVVWIDVDTLPPKEANATKLRILKKEGQDPTQVDKDILAGLSYGSLNLNADTRILFVIVMDTVLVGNFSYIRIVTKQSTNTPGVRTVSMSTYESKEKAKDAALEALVLTASNAL